MGYCGRKDHCKRMPALASLSLDGVKYALPGCMQDWQKVSSTKKVNRYHPPAVRSALQALEVAQEEYTATCKAAWKGFLEDFGNQYGPFRATVQALAALDALHSLSIASRNPGYCTS